MKAYKIFLRWLLAIQIVFVLVVAGAGYLQTHKREQISESVMSNRQSTVSVTTTTKKKIIPVGKTVGIYINTKGILVIDTGEVTDMNGKQSKPAKNRLMKGDYIVCLNGEPVTTKKNLIQAITQCGGESLIFRVERQGEQLDVRVEPVETGVDQYKVGIWVRDDLQGLGTITYIEGEKFGALGHSITDVDTGQLLQVSDGELYEADIFGVEKGVAGKPGEIEGMITYETENVMGYIEKNEDYGIFGTVGNELKKQIDDSEALPVATIQEIREGKAYIQSYVSGQKALYEISIENIHKNDKKDWEMELHVTDETLISLTGGIVQGMSGSPIIQDGKVIGAVTHVFVNDPTRGYGIFIGSMLEH